MNYEARIPLHLVGYSVFEQLRQWARDPSDRAQDEGRVWELLSHEHDCIRCRLCWWIPAVRLREMLHVVHAATSAEEAVAVSLKRFAQWSEEYYAKQGGA